MRESPISDIKGYLFGGCQVADGWLYLVDYLLAPLVSDTEDYTFKAVSLPPSLVWDPMTPYTPLNIANIHNIDLIPAIPPSISSDSC